MTDATADRPPWPRDVDPESGFRLPLPTREALDEDGKAAFDELMQTATSAKRGPAGAGVGLKGPGGIQMYSGRYRRLAQATNWYLRFESGIPGRTRELAILAAAREMDSQFEWTGHEPMALREGLEPEVIDVVRRRAALDGLAEADAVVVRLAREAIGEKRVAAETFAAALALFGSRRLVDLTALIGEYVSVAIQLNVFGMQMPADWPELLPSR